MSFSAKDLVLLELSLVINQSKKKENDKGNDSEDAAVRERVGKAEIVG